MAAVFDTTQTTAKKQSRSWLQRLTILNDLYEISVLYTICGHGNAKSCSKTLIVDIASNKYSVLFCNIGEKLG